MAEKIHNYKIYYVDHEDGKYTHVTGFDEKTAYQTLSKLLGDEIIKVVGIEEVDENGNTIHKESFKNDRADHKLMWELLPLDLIEDIVRVYTFGAEKYAPNTWQNLDDGYNRYKAALMRHIVAYEKGDALDDESNIHHLAHAAWNAIAMLYFAKK